MARPSVKGPFYGDGHEEMSGTAFNLFNRTNFGVHAVSLFNGRGATIPANAELSSPAVTTSRQIQFGTKLIW